MGTLNTRVLVKVGVDLSSLDLSLAGGQKLLVFQNKE